MTVLMISVLMISILMHHLLIPILSCHPLMMFQTKAEHKSNFTIFPNEGLKEMNCGASFVKPLMPPAVLQIGSSS